jgi:hypothetical protein
MANENTKTPITLAAVRRAREAFEAREPRDLFYRAATELVSLALREPARLTVAEALAILLQTWNKNFYRFSKAFDMAHFAEINALLRDHRDALADFRKMKIENLKFEDGPRVHVVFEAFESVLGPVGAAKALHLMAPDFFPLWDRKIAKAYGVPLNGRNSKSDQYWSMFLKTNNECRQLLGEGYEGNPLKAIDEYNYCRYTKRWIED